MLEYLSKLDCDWLVPLSCQRLVNILQQLFINFILTARLFNFASSFRSLFSALFLFFSFRISFFFFIRRLIVLTVLLGFGLLFLMFGLNCMGCLLGIVFVIVFELSALRVSALTLSFVDTCCTCGLEFVLFFC